MGQKTQQPNFKRTLLYTTITLFAISALLGIMAVLFDLGDFTWRIVGTTTAFALISLLSTNNLVRLSHASTKVRVTAIIALIANLLWAVPFILELWGVLSHVGCTMVAPSAIDEYNNSRRMDCSVHYELESFLWKMMALAFSLSITATISSNFLALKSTSSTVKTLKAITIATAMGVEFLFAITVLTEFALSDFLVKLCIILFIVEVFSLIVTPILVKVQSGSSAKQPKTSTKTEAELRAEIEAELRAKLAAEQQANMGALKTPTAEQQAKSEPVAEQNSTTDIEKSTD